MCIRDRSKIKACADALETTPLALLGLSDENPCNTDVLSEEILRLSAALNDVGKQRTIEYIQMLSSNPTFQKPPTKTVSLPIAARGPQGSRHTLTQEEYQEAENTKFDEISPQKQLPKF